MIIWLLNVFSFKYLSMMMMMMRFLEKDKMNIYCCRFKKIMSVVVLVFGGNGIDDWFFVELLLIFMFFVLKNELVYIINWF